MDVEQPAETARLGTAFQALAEVICGGNDFSDVYEAVCAAAPHLVTGCDHASLMVRRRGRMETLAASDDVAHRVDELEREIGEGPCVDAIEDDETYLDSDLEHDPTWPKLAERVLAETPVRAASGFRLRIDAHHTGALNLFSDSPGRLSEQSVSEAVLLASFVSVALSAEHDRQDAATLRAGLESNRQIGKAVGLMMAFHKIDDDQAFAMLVKTSQDLNIKLAEVARRVVEHHNRR